jgi:predicted  nucleic acid-binding Zn-ribbon protein
VNEQLKLLIGLQEIDSRIIEKKRLLKTFPGRLSSLEGSLKSAASLYEVHKQKYDSMKLKQRQKEKDLEEAQDRINKLKTRTSEIKDNKAYQAHLKEIEAKEKEIYNIENEIISIMEGMEAAGRGIKAEETKVNEEKKKVEEGKKTIEAEAEIIKSEMEEFNSRRNELRKSIEGDLYILYMNILDAAKGLAVTEARGEVCLGCNIQIPPQLFLELRKNEEIIHCPQCRRILYYKDDSNEEKE